MITATAHFSKVIYLFTFRANIVENACPVFFYYHAVFLRKLPFFELLSWSIGSSKNRDAIVNTLLAEMHFDFALCKKFEAKNKSSPERIICVYHKPVRYELRWARGECKNKVKVDLFKGG